MSVIFYAMSLSVASVAVPLLALDAGYSAAAIGGLVSISAASQMMARLGLGALMRRVGDWAIVAAAGLLLALSGLVLVVTADLLPFVLSQVLQGVSRALFWTGNQTHVVRVSKRAIGALARFNLISSVGLLVGPALAGLVGERSMAAAMGVSALFAMGAFLPALAFDRLPAFPPRPKERGRLALYRIPGVLEGCWAGVTAGAWRGLLQSFVPIALSAGRVSTGTIGLLISVANAGQIVGAAAAGKLRQRWVGMALGWSFVLAGGAMAMVAFVASEPMWAGSLLVVSALGSGILQTAGMAVASDAVPADDRGDVIAASGAFRAAALLGSPLAVSGLIAVVPLASAMAITGAVLALPVISMRRWHRVQQERRR